MWSLLSNGLTAGLILTVLAYLLGSLSSAVLVCRLLGLPDPRESGSGNPGATNVLRLGGKKAAALTLIGDMLKGLLPTAIASAMGLPMFWVALVALGAVTGHLLPVFFGFRGGKGVATGLGAVIGAHWVSGLLAITLWLASCLVFKISSLAALITFAAIPLLFLVAGAPAAAAVFTLITLLLYWRHRGNIARLVAGQEPRLGASKKHTEPSQQGSDKATQT